MIWRRAVTFWLCLGLFMVFVQIIVGGITRLTGSGLSITKWEIVTGTIPPTTEEQWAQEFELYKATPQYAKINKGMDLGESIFDAGTFKFIYFWEFIHRFWARIMGFVFLFPFVFFWFKGAISKRLAKHLGIVVLCAALAALFGWIMVASGLVDRPWVDAYKLSIHLSIGFAVFLTLVRAFVYYRSDLFFVGGKTEKNLSKWTFSLFVILCLQVFLGGIMSGTKAALFYPTWPDMNGVFLPEELLAVSNWKMQNFIDYDKSLFVVGLIQFLHRITAYAIALAFGLYVWRKKPWLSRNRIFVYSFFCFSFLLLAQILLGIITVVTSVGDISVLWGVLHQGVAVLLLAASLVHFYQSKNSNAGISTS